jgi:TonB-dependent starch-binding outer membrane protein SusC
MRKLITLGIAIFMLTGYVLAQSRTVTGKVTDEKGSPLSGATVSLLGGKGSTVTNGDGRFGITTDTKTTGLEISYVGYATTSITLDTRSDYSIQLSSATRDLDEIVITGYSAEKKRDITGAVTSVKAKEIENMPVQTLDRAIQGRMAGVQVQSNNGTPGGNVTIRIRGTGSINAGNSPLYIVDGIQMTGGDLSRSLPTSNSLAGLNPNDIESIDVLKDASAAIYGAQAANGVVIITTKKGKAGKTKFGINYQNGFTERINKVDMTSGAEFLELIYEARRNNVLNAGGDPATAALTTTSFLGLYGLTPDKFSEAPTYDWQDAVNRRGYNHNVELTASGGNEQTTFYMSGSFNKFDGQIIASDFTRGQFRINVDHKASAKLRFDTRLNVATYTQNAVQTSNSSGGVVFSALFVPPVQPIYNPDGTYAEPLIGGRTSNVVKVANYDVYKGTTNQLFGSVGATYSILPNLSFRSVFNLDYTDILEDRYIDPRTIAGSAFAGQANALNTRQINWSTDQVFTYGTNFGRDHLITALAGFTYRNVVSTTITAQGRGFANELFQTLQSAATPFSVSANYTTYRLAGYFTKLGYTFKGKYILNGTLRYDGSSRFGENKKFGWFPSAAFAWKAGEEDFIRDLNVFSDLKVRASYGITGNGSIDNFASRTLYTGTGAYNGVGGISPSGLGDANLAWEENRTLNFGLDFGFLRNRITGTVEVFRRNTDKLLLDRPLPQTSGFSTIMQNLGALKNEGLELQLTTVNIDGKFKWSTDFNWTWLRSEVTDLGGPDRVGTSYFVGQPMQVIFQPEYAGVNPATGRAFWYDVNGNPTYQPLTSGATDSRRIIGTALPTSYGGLTNNFSYKGFELAIFFQGQFGNMLLNNNGYFLESMGAFESNVTQRAYDRRWQKPGDITDMPRFYSGTEPRHRGLNSFSGRNYEDASYIRLKQISLSYVIASKVLSRAGIVNPRIYLQSTNLATFTGYTGYDPEIVGSDLGAFPQGRTLTAGISFTF